MKRIVLIVGAALLAATYGNEVWAQIPQYTTGPQTGSGGPSLKRSTRPAVSAYTGLLGSSVGAAGGVGYQYFTRVQPQISTQRSLGNLGRSLNRLQSQTQAGGALGSLSPAQLAQLQQQQALGIGLGTTGHPTGYGSHIRYFATDKQGGTILSGGGGGGGTGLSGTGVAGSSPYFGGSGPVRR
jgi:hypothetical protein